MLKTCWKQFLLVQLPSAALVLTLGVQALAFALSGLPLWRARRDEVALATLKDPTQFRILLFGDSITSMATGKFSLGEDVGNISTDGGVGVHGALFQLERYLSVHRPPERIVLIYSPAGYHERSNLRMAHYDLWHVYNRPEERDFLRAYLPGIERRDWLPAIFDVQERIIEPIASFFVLRTQSPRMDVGVPTLVARRDAPAGMAVRAETADDDRNLKPLLDTSLSAAIAEALTRMCGLARKHGFRIDVAWPPVPQQLLRIMTSSGTLAELEARITSIMEGHCEFGGFNDFNKIRTYPNSSFRNDLIHLFDYGWEQRYTADLVEYLHGLRGTSPAPNAAIGVHAIGTTEASWNRPETGGDRPSR